MTTWVNTDKKWPKRMSRPITWRNIPGSNNGALGAAQILGGAQDSFNNSFSILNGLMNRYQNTQAANRQNVVDNNTAAFMDRLNQFTNPDELAAARDGLLQDRAAYGNRIDREATRGAVRSRIEALQNQANTDRTYREGEALAAAQPVLDRMTAERIRNPDYQPSQADLDALGPLRDDWAKFTDQRGQTEFQREQEAYKWNRKTNFLDPIADARTQRDEDNAAGVRDIREKFVDEISDRIIPHGTGSAFVNAYFDQLPVDEQTPENRAWFESRIEAGSTLSSADTQRMNTSVATAIQASYPNFQQNAFANEDPSSYDPNTELNRIIGDNQDDDGNPILSDYAANLLTRAMSADGYQFGEDGEKFRLTPSMVETIVKTDNGRWLSFGDDEIEEAIKEKISQPSFKKDHQEYFYGDPDNNKPSIQQLRIGGEKAWKENAGFGLTYSTPGAVNLPPPTPPVENTAQTPNVPVAALDTAAQEAPVPPAAPAPVPQASVPVQSTSTAPEIEELKRAVARGPSGPWDVNWQNANRQLRAIETAEIRSSSERLQQLETALLKGKDLSEFNDSELLWLNNRVETPRGFITDAKKRQGAIKDAVEAEIEKRGA